MDIDYSINSYVTWNVQGFSCRHWFSASGLTFDSSRNLDKPLRAFGPATSSRTVRSGTTRSGVSPTRCTTGIFRPEGQVEAEQILYAISDPWNDDNDGIFLAKVRSTGGTRLITVDSFEGESVHDVKWRPDGSGFLFTKQHFDFGIMADV
jgi:hypothetical protein